MRFAQISLLLCLFSMFIPTSYCAVAFGLHTEDPDHPGLCHYKTDSITLYLKPGEVKRHPKGCWSIRCNSDFSLDFTGCGIYGKEDHCRLVVDLSKPFPSCCGDVVC